MKTKKLIILGIIASVSIGTASAITVMPSFDANSRNTGNSNECWYQDDDGEIKPCVTDTVGIVLPIPQEGFCDETNNDSFCVDRKTFESQYVGGGSLDSDPDLAPSYALDFVGSSFYLNFLPIVSLIAIISSLFLVPYFILKRKNIPSRPYMSLILSGLLLHYGITNLISFLLHSQSILQLIDRGESYMIEQLFVAFWIPVIVLFVAGILLYRSSVIRKLIKK